MKRKNIFLYFVRNISTAIGLVLIWRGIWYAVDSLDIMIFGGSHFWTSILGVAIGLAILYLPDNDLKELEKL